MSTSYNGWQASSDPRAIGVAAFSAGGVSFPSGVKSGDVATVLRYVADQFDVRVESLVAGWCWGYAYRQNRNASNLSCHSSGTAIDCNAPGHPNGARGTFSAAQVRTIRAILAEVDGVVRWGGDFSGTPDEMHFEIKGTAAQVAAVANRLTRARAQAAVNPQPLEEDIMASLDEVRDVVRDEINRLSGGPRTRDAAGNVIDGDPQTISVADVYTLVEKLAARPCSCACKA